LQSVGGDPLPMTPDDFAQFTRAERVKWAAVVKGSGVPHRLTRPADLSSQIQPL